MEEEMLIEDHRDEQPEPAWVAGQIYPFTAATGVKVGFARLGEASLLDNLSGFCDVFRFQDSQRQAACRTWHQCQAVTVKQSIRAIRLRCPMMLEYLWAPVSRGGVIYGFLYTEPVLRTDHAAGQDRAREKAWSLGEESKDLAEEHRRMTESFQRILRVKTTQRDGLLVLLELVAQRLGARFHEEERLPVPLDPSEALVRRAKVILCSLYHEKISTCDVANGLHVSESHLCHAFHSVTGGTLRQHLNELRFTEACRLLREHPHLSIAEVAFAAGFQSLSRFSEQFRRRNMQSPGKWRQSHVQMG